MPLRNVAIARSTESPFPVSVESLILKNSFIEMKFTYHTIHPFEVYDSLVFVMLHYYFFKILVKYT